MKGISIFLLGFLMLMDIKFGELQTFPFGYIETDSTEDATMDPTTTEEPYITPGTEMWFAKRRFGCPGNDRYCYRICRDLNFRAGHCVHYLFTCECYDCLEEDVLNRSLRGYYKCMFRPSAIAPPKKTWSYK